MSASLDRIYAQVPEAGCRGLCVGACGVVVPIEGAEARRVRAAQARAGVAAGWDEETLTCNALTPDGRCAIYDDRPLVCRVYGVVEGMLCEHGCQEVPLLSRRRAHQLYAAAARAPR